MATKLKKEKSGESCLVQGHKVCGSDDLAAIHVATATDLTAQIKEQALMVKCEVDDDPNMNYEHKTLVHKLIFPLAFIMTIWAFLKTAGWAILTFIRHEELVYESQKGKPQSFPGKKTIVKWFNLKAAMRVWWCVPQEKRGETLKPKYASLFFDRFSEPLKSIRSGSASWKALDIIYHHAFNQDHSLGGKLADFWISMMNAQAVRNRHKLASKELAQAIIRCGKREVKLLSVACGSAEAVIQVVKSLKDNYDIRVYVTLLDLDERALLYARKLVVKYGIEGQFVTLSENIKNIESVVTDKFDVIEMLGFLDYQFYIKAVALVTKLRLLLEPEGCFLTCNIVPNLERHFLRWIISWPMLYRRPREFAKIMVAAGFEPNRVKIILEPLKIHAIAVCRVN